MVRTAQRSLHLIWIWPWQDRKRKVSWLKASTFTLMFMLAIWLPYQVDTEQFGLVPLGGMTYWLGLWATAILLLALTITPAMTIFRRSQFIIVRRMIGLRRSPIRSRISSSISHCGFETCVHRP